MSKETIELERQLGVAREENAGLNNSLKSWKQEAARFREKYLAELEERAKAIGRCEQAMEDMIALEVHHARDVEVMIFIGYSSLFVALAGIAIAIYLYLAR